MSFIQLKRLTGDQILHWQITSDTSESRFPEFEVANMYSRIVRRSLDFYWIETEHYEAAELGDMVARQLCDQARERMEWDISYLIWRNCN